MCLGWDERSFGLSVKQLLDFTLLEPGIVSDLVKGVRLYDLPVMEDCVQQILQWSTDKDMRLDSGQSSYILNLKQLNNQI